MTRVTDRPLTSRERDVMFAIDNEGPRTARDIASDITVRATYDATHSRLRHLEDREFVRRVGANPSKWQLTEAGRKALERE